MVSGSHFVAAVSRLVAFLTYSSQFQVGAHRCLLFRMVMARVSMGKFEISRNFALLIG